MALWIQTKRASRRFGRTTGPLVILWSLVTATTVSAQPNWLSGYVQTVPLLSGPTQSSPASVSDFNRLRLSLEPSWGPVSLEAAYEHAITISQHGTQSGFLGAVPNGGEWLPLDNTVVDQDHVQWRQRLDRLNVRFSPSQSLDLTIGRQAVSWGTTLFLTPADPFLPFNPADPFRQFRGGVDVARLQMYPGPLSTVDVVVRATNSLLGEEVTALGRGLTTWQNWELSAWGGTLYGDTAGAVGISGSLGTWALRAEGVVRELRGRIIGRGALGLDRVLQIADRDLFLIFEYQRDGLAAAAPARYTELLLTPEFLRGELQTLGRDVTVAQASYQVSPLWNLAGLSMWNMNDNSTLVAPSVTYTAGDETVISGGIYFGFGDAHITASQPLPSEFGLASSTGYLSFSVFF